MEEHRQYHGGLVWPVILIAAGVVFLLNNMGLLSWSIWETLWRLWPVLLIAAGLDILIGRRSRLGSLIVALLLVGVLAAAIGWGVPAISSNAGVASQVDRTESITEDLKGATEAEVEIRFGAGVFYLAALPEGSGQLLAGKADLSKGEGLRLAHEGNRLELHSQGTWTTAPNIRADERKVWDLELNRDIPIDLQISTGVGQSNLDLTQINLRSLDINGGVGQATVKLAQRGRYKVEIDGGVGEIILSLPPGLAARISVDSGLGGVSVNGNFNRRNKEYVSPNFDTAENRVEINVDGGIGRIVIRQTVE